MNVRVPGVRKLRNRINREHPLLELSLGSRSFLDRVNDQVRKRQNDRPHHEEILLDGTAQSVRYGKSLRDRSGRPDNTNSQEVAILKISSWEEMQQNWNCL